MAKTKPKKGYKTIGHQKMWCNICDSRQVDSTKPASGSFYKVFGLQHAPETLPASVFFAICPHCKAANAIIPISKVEDLIIQER
jgi:hypothetical protein